MKAPVNEVVTALVKAKSRSREQPAFPALDVPPV